jgi:hypothetical protein
MRLIAIIAALVGFTGAFRFLAGGRQSVPKEQKMTLQPPLEGLPDYRMRERTRLILALAEFRKEWQEAVNGGSLLKVESPVGLILADIADRLELSFQERYAVLGGKLINEVDAACEQRVRRKLPL